MLQFLLDAQYSCFSNSRISKNVSIEIDLQTRGIKEQEKFALPEVRVITSLIVSRNKRLLEIEFTAKTNFVRTNILPVSFSFYYSPSIPD